MISNSGVFIDGLLVLPGEPLRPPDEPRRILPSRYGLDLLEPGQDVFIGWRAEMPERVRNRVQKHIQRLHAREPLVVFHMQSSAIGVRVTRTA
jgi:hypothetical protein